MATMKELMEYEGSEEGVCVVDKPYNPNFMDNKTPFGARWGGEVITITQEHIDALISGKYIALDIEREYVAFLKLSPKDLGDSHELQTPQ